MWIEGFCEPEIGSVEDVKRFAFQVFYNSDGGPYPAKCALRSPVMGMDWLDMNTIHKEWEADFPREMLIELEAILSAMKVSPLEHADTLAMHGGYHGLKVKIHQNSLHFEWSNAPDSWAPIEKWLRQAVTLLFPEYRRYEPPRVSRRLQPLREWSHYAQAQHVFT